MDETLRLGAVVRAVHHPDQSTCLVVRTVAPVHQKDDDFAWLCPVHDEPLDWEDLRQVVLCNRGVAVSEDGHAEADPDLDATVAVSSLRFIALPQCAHCETRGEDEAALDPLGWIAGHITVCPVLQA